MNMASEVEERGHKPRDPGAPEAGRGGRVLPDSPERGCSPKHLGLGLPARGMVTEPTSAVVSPQLAVLCSGHSPRTQTRPGSSWLGSPWRLQERPAAVPGRLGAA